MTGHHFAFTCPHCAGGVYHRGAMRQGVASCPGCGADYRIDVRVAQLHGPRLRATQPDAVYANPDAPGRALIDLITAAQKKAA